jgi:hypothetical protein
VRTSFERRVSTPDGRIAGIIDYVRESPEGVLVRDYKAGNVYERGATSRPEIKPEYADQIKLYAALFNAAVGTWPNRLEIVPIGSAAIEVPFSVAECTALLDAAYSELDRANARIDSAEAQTPPARDQLASPSAGTCRFCSFRPACSIYWQAREDAPSDETNCDWPNDIRGTVQLTQPLGNGMLMLKVNTAQSGVYVRLLASWNRQNVIDALTPGLYVELYGLSNPNGATLFNSTDATAIYTQAGILAE